MIAPALAPHYETLAALGFRKEGLAPLTSYLEFLWKSNEELNLISRKMTPQELIENHVIDCLLPLKHFPTDAKVVADFGSGGGLPGVIFAIQFPKVEFHLFEKSPKKQEFLLHCQEFAPNLRIHGEIPTQLKNIDLITARAFKPIDVILDMSRSYFAAKGKYFLLKGRNEKIQEELTLATKKFKNIESKIVSLDSPVLAVERHIVWIN